MVIKASDIRAYGCKWAFHNIATAPQVGGVAAFYRKVLANNQLSAPSIITLQYNGTPHPNLQYRVIGAGIVGIICEDVSLAGGSSSTFQTFYEVYAVEKLVYITNAPSPAPLPYYTQSIGDDILNDGDDDGHIDTVNIPAGYATVVNPTIDDVVYVRSSNELLATLENADNNMVPADAFPPAKGVMSPEEVISYTVPFFWHYVGGGTSGDELTYDKMFILNGNTSVEDPPVSALNAAKVKLELNVSLPNATLRFGLDDYNNDSTDTDRTIQPGTIDFVDEGETLDIPGVVGKPKNILDAADTIGVWLEFSTGINATYFPDYRVTCFGEAGTGCVVPENVPEQNCVVGKAIVDECEVG